MMTLARVAYWAAQTVGTAPTTTVPGFSAAGTNWNEVIAIATCVTALGVFGAIAAAWWAGKGVRETEKSRHAEMATHMSSLWSSAELAAARLVLHAGLTRRQIRDSYIATWQGSPSTDDQKVYQAADAIANFFEDLGVMELLGGLGLSWIQLTMGSSVLLYWNVLEPSIRAIRELNEQPTAYENFELLSYRLSEARPPKVTRRRRANRQRMPTTTA
jgi:hypothetical protein